MTSYARVPKDRCAVKENRSKEENRPRSKHSTNNFVELRKQNEKKGEEEEKLLRSQRTGSG